MYGPVNVRGQRTEYVWSSRCNETVPRICLGQGDMRDYCSSSY